MLQFTDAARDKLAEIVQSSSPEDQKKAVRIHASPGAGGRHQFGFQFDDAHDDDVTLDIGSVKVVLGPTSAEILEEGTVDYIVNGAQEGFKFNLPESATASPQSAPPETTEDTNHPLLKRVQEVFEEDINPAVASHGGFIQIVNVVDDKLYIRMGGGCQGCSSSTATLRQGVETLVKAKVPEVTQIIDMTDHASGVNPYYA
ncbi:MAG: NifU family protein [Planctomycetota bacterium]